jgi:hypothetical protein
MSVAPILHFEKKPETRSGPFENSDPEAAGSQEFSVQV